MSEHPEIQPRPLTPAEEEAISDARRLGSHLEEVACQLEMLARSLVDASFELENCADEAKHLHAEGRTGEISRTVLLDNDERQRLWEDSRLVDSRVQQLDVELCEMNIPSRASRPLGDRPERIA